MSNNRKLIANLIETPEDNQSIMEKLALLPEEERIRILEDVVSRKYPDKGWPALRYDWDLWARPNQLVYKDLEWEKWKNLVLCAGRGFGKGGSLDTPIRTASEWKTLGTIAVGDIVFDERGRMCNVTAVTDTYIPNKAYRLHFSDGTYLEVCDEHQFVTWTHRDRKAYLRKGDRAKNIEDTTRFPDNWVNWRKTVHLTDRSGKTKVGINNDIGPKIRTTQDLVDTFVYGTRSDRNHCIPLAGPLQTPEAKDLPIDPYIYGLYLGDGGVRTGIIASHIEDYDHYKERISAVGYSVSDFRPQKDKQSGVFNVYGLVQQLKKAGIFNDKSVDLSEIYLRASEHQRLELVRGLLDTDGSCLKSGLVEFTNTNKYIIDLTYDLLVSLGQKPVLSGRWGKVYGVKKKWAYRLTFMPTRDDIFSLPRKVDRIKMDGTLKQRLRNHHRMIVSYEEIDPIPMKCIQVDSPNSMYLLGRGLIPTHNTRVGAEYVRYLAENALVDRIALVGATNGDVNKVMIGGVSGILSVCPPWNMPYHSPTRKTLEWPNGVIAEYFSSVEPERLRGPQFGAAWLDEFCLVAGTKIKTDKGFLPIELIEDGVTVVTRVGPKKVKKAWKTSDSAETITIRLSNGEDITCTNGHPIYIKNRGILKANSVAVGDVVYSYKEYEEKCKNLRLLQQKIHNILTTNNTLFQKPSYGTVSGGTSIEGITNHEQESFFTEPILSFGLDILQKAQLFIILTEIARITQSLIYLHFPEENMQDSTLPNLLEESSYLPTKSGHNTLETFGKLKNLDDINVYLVEAIFYQLDKLLNFAQTDVERSTIEKFVLGKFQEFVNDAENILWATNAVNCVLENVLSTSPEKRDTESVLCALNNTMLQTHILKLVLEHVDTNIEQISVESVSQNKLLSSVYNFEVEDEHNYFANNTLVSNCAWSYQQETYDMLSFGLRNTDFPKLIITTTPKPQSIFLEILANPETYTVTGSTMENRANLGKGFIKDVVERYENTRLGRQELEAQILTDVPGALWQQNNIDANRVSRNKFGDLPDFMYIVLAVDPAMTSNKNSAETGICVAAFGMDGDFYVLHLDSVKQTPSEWARAVLEIYDDFIADQIIVETNQGGDLVIANLKQVRSHLNVMGVHAYRGKVLRAEPIASLYERGKVHHVGFFSKAEDQMINFNPIENPNGLKDCVDALVYALTALVDKTNTAYALNPAVGGFRTKLLSYKHR